jgi:ATP-binding cassette subfamily F protein 3
MFDPASAEPALAKLTMGDLMKRRGETERKIAAIEAAWIDASEKLERVAA